MLEKVNVLQILDQRLIQPARQYKSARQPLLYVSLLLRLYGYGAWGHVSGQVLGQGDRS